MAQGPQALKYTLRAVYEGQNQDLTGGLEVEAKAFEHVFDTEDRIEGSQAFLERRQANFKNK